jgi:peptidyl-prolyl cis-trans isomerase SurA
MKFVKSIVFFLAVLFSQMVNAQQDSIYVLDKVIAVVGDEIVLKSDVEQRKVQMRQEGVSLDGDYGCFALENLLSENLFLDQGKLDTIEADEGMIQSELDRRIAMFIQQIGSQEALVEYFGKSINEIKADFHDPLKNQMIVQQVQQTITADINVTPSDVQLYYNNIPEDSLPMINTQIEYAQLVVFPPENPAEIEKVKQRLRGFIKEVREGEDFATLAVLYSDDPGSAPKGGDLGMVPRGTMVGEFDEVAFQLSDGEISGVFETEFGYHIMQMIERRGEQYHARHILLKPKTTSADMNSAKEKLIEIQGWIATDTITWIRAVLMYSQDEQTFNNKGLAINMMTGTPRFDLNQLDPQAYVAIEKMEVDEIAGPILYQTREGNEGYRLVKLLKRIEPHRANLVDDYQILQEAATSEAKVKATKKWIVQKINNTYINIDDNYHTCDWEFEWIKNIE